MQPNIPTKFAGYVAWILLCKHCKFGEEIYYNSRDIEFFLGDYFFWRALFNKLISNMYKWRTGENHEKEHVVREWDKTVLSQLVENTVWWQLTV